MMPWILAVLTICLTLPAGADTAPGRARVDIRAQATVRGAWILLQDVAAVQADPAYTGPALGTIRVGRAPLPGSRFILSRAQMIQMLKAGAVLMEQVDLAGAAETAVVREKQTVSAAEIERRVRSYILEQMPWAREDVEIGPVSGARELTLPAGALRYGIAAQKQADFLGRTSFEVRIATADVAEKHLWVNADIRVYAPVVVARRPLGRLSRIGPDDVVVEKRNLAQVPQDAVRAVAELSGKRSRRNIQAGEPIRASQVEVPPAVKRGDLVTLRVENNTLVITALGKVLETGKPGEVIRVENISSHREVYGRVIDSKTIEARF